jgi:ABC-type lipoprotein export system ATPase subunit
LVGKFNFLILDEVLELSLDTKGKEEVIKLLVDNFKQEPVFVISHDPEIKGSFDSVIEVKYENGVSRI